MKVIYTIVNTKTNDCYVWQTNSLSRRIHEHVLGWLFEVLQIKYYPLFIVVRSWELIIEVFFTNKQNEDEKKQRQKMKNEWYNMKNKSFKYL